MAPLLSIIAPGSRILPAKVVELKLGRSMYNNYFGFRRKLSKYFEEIFLQLHMYTFFPNFHLETFVKT